MRPAAVLDAVLDTDRFVLVAVPATGSTNSDLAAGGPVRDGRIAVLTAEQQLAGRGRAGREWVCPAGAGLIFSLRMSLARVAPERRGWTGAVLGLAIVRALAGEPMITANLKWPNDVLIGPAKCAGILGELAGDDVVVGAGINVSLVAAELPRPDATSLLLAGARSLDRGRLLTAILNELLPVLDAWTAAGGDVDHSGLRRAYRQECSTLGAPVRVELPAGQQVEGVATDIDRDGSVVLRLSDGSLRGFAAGDVVHLRRQY